MTTIDQPTRQDIGALAMPTPADVTEGRRRLHRKAVLIASVFVLGYGGLVFAPVNIEGRLGFAAVLVIGCVALATSVMHDGNHGSFARSARASRAAGWTSDLLGASSFLWRFKHNVLHHGNTNVVGFDTDIDQAPFARLAPQQQWHPWHRYQHLYMWLLYGFLTLQWFVVSDFSTMIRGRVGEHALRTPLRRRDVALILIGKTSHVVWALAIPMLVHPWWGVLAFYLGCSWLVGFLLSTIFQLAHCVDRADFFTPDEPRRGADFASHQLRSTVDIRCTVPVLGRFMHWLMGGLDCQVEHHLAPRIPHALYRDMAPRVEALAHERGLDYRVHPTLTAAVRSHARWLHQMGQRPSDS